jgi:hypothetical protein
LREKGQLVEEEEMSRKWSNERVKKRWMRKGEGDGGKMRECRSLCDAGLWERETKELQGAA